MTSYYAILFPKNVWKENFWNQLHSVWFIKLKEVLCMWNEQITSEYVLSGEGVLGSTCAWNVGVTSVKNK